jgi:hypothetical protein
VTDEQQVVQEAAIAAALDGPPVVDDGSARTSRITLIAFVIALVLLALVAAAPTAGALGALLDPSAGGCGGG